MKLPTSSHPALTSPRAASDPQLLADWEGIRVPAAVKHTILHHALLALTLRAGQIAQVSIPVHGLLVLAGPPGTGKSSLARGLAGQLGNQLGDRLGPVTLVELNPHALASELHGQTQRSIASILEEHVPAVAQDGPTVLLLDEVEALAASREGASTKTNPVDVHRATDAVLSGLDRLARECPKLVSVATTNFEATVDSALLSRADKVIPVPPPDAEAIAWMVADTLTAVADVRGAGTKTPIRKAIADKRLAEVAERLVGLDGRQARKFVIDAFTREVDLTLAPERLGIDDLLAAAAEHGAASTATRKADAA